ncbi:hypothetical protein M406DRAFT_23042, partial [Cryphonectria parasitica EP155]
LKRATQKELEYTTDPYHIAENVAKKLAAKDFDKALLLTQTASKDKQVIVSWNHLIEYQFQNQKLQAAIKLFNDMKKRAQLPNAQTYTIIFKGCAQSIHPKLAVGEALKIYHAMLNSSRLKPNTIHLNAVLDVCARAQDLESMFVALRSASGIRAPNNLTYTIILNALRHQKSNYVNQNEDAKEQEPAVKASIETTISRAKLVWDEVITRWKKGEIIMDEELMCAMGRVLLLGGAKETDSILEVVGEVLGITNLLDGQPETEPEPPTPEPRRQMPSRSLTPRAMINVAGNNTLSLVMRALAQDKRTKLAARYWDFMSISYGIVPDRRNYRDYIDCLSTGASSSKAARVLASLPGDIPDGNLYRRGLLLCHFDTYNANAFQNATTIYDAMVRKLKVPDARCMKLYLQVSTSSYRGLRDTDKSSKEAGRAGAYGQQMLTALDRVWEPLRRATNALSYSDAATSSASPEEAWKRSHANREEVMEVAKRFVATSDKVLSQNLISKTDE